MRLFKENALSLSHLPTWMLIIGLPVYWLEIYFHQNNYGIATPTAAVLFALVVTLALRQAIRIHSGTVKKFWPESRLDRGLMVCGLMACLGMIAVYLYASLLPPHLPQEEDVLNYHYTFPRQHLIRNAFKYIRWSTCDLFPYPVQFGLAPFWFATELPNKLPQFFFLLAMPFLMVRLLKIVGQPDLLKCVLVVFAFFGAHHVVIQGGTAMLDIVLAYLFFAALDSLLRGNWILAAIEFVFYFWSKSFAPFQMTAVLIVLVIALIVLRKFGFLINWSFSGMPFKKFDAKFLRRFFILFFILSVFVAGPFLYKSLMIGGTPLYPFFVGVFPHAKELPWDWNSFVAAAKYDISMKDAYGLPRTALNFIQHFWMVAVPQEGVNNVFDYPVGLVYLLCLGPFFWFMGQDLLKKRIGILPLLICIFWATWWMGSQQSRFLYVPLFLMYVTVISQIRFSRVFFVSILIALMLSALSAFRAHRADFGVAPEALLRAKDRELRKLSQEYIMEGKTGIVVVDNYQAAYAQFPARVLAENIPYTLQIQSFR